MKLNYRLFLPVIFLLTNTAFAQTVSSDAINALHNDNKMLKIAMTINDQKIEMAKLQNQLPDIEKDAEEATTASQHEADANQNNATILNNDDLNKNKANKAKKSAKRAEKSSTKARKAQCKLDDLNKDIDRLKKDISENEEKLTSMGGSQYVHPSN